MKIVVLDGYTLNPGDLSWEGMEKFGQLTVYDRTSESEVLSRIGNAEHVLVNKVPISREIIYKAQNLK
jgi:glycerate dehydrogenase